MPIARVQLPDGRIGRFEVEEGTTPQEIEAYVAQQFNPEQKQPQGDFTEPMSVAALKPGEPVATGEPRPGAETLSALARPILGGVGAVIGAVAGTTGAPGPGTLAGSGLGFAAGEELADKLDEWLGVRDRQPLSVELVQSGKDVATGAAFEAGGQLLATGLGAGAKFVAKRLPKISLTKSGAKKQAGKVIAANTTGGPVIAKNIEEAQALEEAIPGLKFGRGQTTNDPAVIKFERSRQRMPGDAAEQTAEQTAANSKALRAFIDKQKGGSGIGDVVDPLVKQREAVEAGVDTAAGALEREAATLGTGADSVEAGATIRGAAGSGKATAKKEAGKLFEDVPQFDIDSSSLGTKIDELSKPFSRVENIEANIPSVFGRTKALLEETGGVLTPDDLQGIRSELTTDLRRVQGGQEPNARKASRISGLIGEIDDILKGAGGKTKQATPKEEISLLSDNLKKDGISLNATYADYKNGIEIGKIVVPETGRGLGKGTDAMKKIIEIADKNDLTIALTPSKDFGGDVPRLKKFYKELGFVENKGVNKDYEFSDTFIREPNTATKIDAIIGTEAAEKLKTAQQFFKKEVIEKFQSGSIGDILKKSGGQHKITNANVASRFFKPGPNGAETVQEFINAIGTDKNARRAMEDYIQQDLLTNATNPITGEVTNTKLKTWLAKYKPALRKLGITDRFKNIEAARQQLDKAIEIRTAFDKSVASKVLGSDVDSAVKNAFSSGSKGRAANQLMNQLKGDKNAIAGLQNATIDHIIDTAQTTASDAFNNPIISLAGVEREFKKLKPAIDVIFKDSPGKLVSFNKYRQALKILQRGKASPLGGGSDTMENTLTALAQGSGLSAGKVATIVRAVMKPILNMSDNQVNALLNRAAFDPDFAHTLIMASRGTPVDIIERRLKGHLASLGMKAFKGEK